MEPVIKGHPLHPILVTLPIGLFTGSYLLDIAALITGNEKYAEASYYNMFIGTLSVAPTATTGLLDFLQMSKKDPAYKMGVTHGLLNAGLTSIYGLSLLLRRKNKRNPAGLMTATVGLGGLLISGVLGGEIAHGRGWRVRASERFELEWQKEHQTGPFAPAGSNSEEYPPAVVKAFREHKSGAAVFAELKEDN